jgi:hypothetical protein
MITQMTQTILFEMKLYLKSRNFWLVAFLLNSYTWTAFLLAGQVMSGVAQMFIPALLFLTADTVTRDKREYFTEIIATLPYNDMALLGGRALALFIWFLLLGMELLSTIVLVNMGIPVYSSWSAGEAFLVKYVVACINVIGITFFVFSVTKNRVRFYALLLLWWLIGVFLTGNVGMLFPQWVAIANFTFIHGFGGNPSEVIGIYPNDELVVAIILYQITCSTILFMIAVLIEKARRRTISTILHACSLQVLACIAIILVLFFVTYQSLGINSSDHIHASVNRLPVEVRRDALPVIAPAAYDLYVTLNSKSHTMAVKAQIIIKKLGETSPSTIEFTLRDYLHVEQVVNMATGEPLVWQQQGTYVIVSLSSEDFSKDSLLTLGINYSGKVWEWSNDFYGQRAGLVNMVDSSFTCLRGGYAWYPVLGRHQLYTASSYTLPWQQESKQILQSMLVFHGAVPFKMTVESHENMTVFSNIELTNKYRDGDTQRYIFTSQAGRDVFLLAGPYEHTKLTVPGREEAVDFYHFPGHDGNLHKMAYKVSQLDYYNSLVPRGNPSGLAKGYLIFEAPRFLTYDNLMNSSNLGFIDVIALPEAIFLTKSLYSPWWSQPAGRILSEARSLNLWWANCFKKEKGDIADGLALYMYTLYNEHKHGKRFYDNAREYWLSYQDESPDNEDMLGVRGQIVREVFLLMDTIRQSNLGDDGVKQFLRLIYAAYQEKNILEATDIVAALQLIGALDAHHQQGNDREVKYHNSIDTLNQLLTSPPENRSNAALKLQLNWDFGTQIKVKEAQ